MPVTAGIAAPYAPPSAVMDVVQRHRSKGLPAVVDAGVLERIGVSHSLVPRTLMALTTLDLIDVDGRPTQTFERLRLAAEADYQGRLRDWLDAAYADALAFVDPATASESQLRDAFRKYKPAGQQARMVTLFLGLYAAAGVAPGRRVGQQHGETATARGSPRRNTAGRQGAEPQREPAPAPGPSLPAPIAGLLTRLPSEGSGWTRQERDQLVTAFAAILDVCFPIRVGGNEEGEGRGGGQGSR